MREQALPLFINLATPILHMCHEIRDILISEGADFHEASRTRRHGDVMRCLGRVQGCGGKYAFMTLPGGKLKCRGYLQGEGAALRRCGMR